MKKVLKIKVSNEEIFLEYLGKKKVFLAPRQQSEKLLPAIEKFCNLKELEALEVNNSGASFTALRIGVSTANALAYALGIELILTNKSSFSFKGKKYAKPLYDHNPVITKI